MLSYYQGLLKSRFAQFSRENLLGVWNYKPLLSTTGVNNPVNTWLSTVPVYNQVENNGKYAFSLISGTQPPILTSKGLYFNGASAMGLNWGFDINNSMTYIISLELESLIFQGILCADDRPRTDRPRIEILNQQFYAYHIGQGAGSAYNIRRTPASTAINVLIDIEFNFAAGAASEVIMKINNVIATDNAGYLGDNSASNTHAPAMVLGALFLDNVYKDFLRAYIKGIAVYNKIISPAEKQKTIDYFKEQFDIKF